MAELFLYGTPGWIEGTLQLLSGFSYAPQGYDQPQELARAVSGLETGQALVLAQQPQSLMAELVQALSGCSARVLVMADCPFSLVLSACAMNGQVDFSALASTLVAEGRSGIVSLQAGRGWNE